jgi:hypothetical protein
MRAISEAEAIGSIPSAPAADQVDVDGPEPASIGPCGSLTPESCADLVPELMVELV